MGSAAPTSAAAPAFGSLIRPSVAATSAPAGGSALAGALFGRRFTFLFEKNHVNFSSLIV